MSNISPIILTRNINATPEKVFAALSQPELMRLWLKPNSKWDAKTTNTFCPGGSFNHCMITEEGKSYEHFGEYKQITTPKKLVFTWNSDYAKDTLVTIELKEHNNQTEITLIHDHFTE